MANQLQLQRQIQEEIDREAKIDRLIKNQMKKFFRYNKQFKIVDERKDCDSIFIENNPYQQHLLLMINLKIFYLIKDIHIFFLKIKIITMEDEVV